MSFGLALGSDGLDAVFEVFRSIADGAPNDWVRTLGKEECDTLRYSECICDLPDLKGALLSGDVISIQLSKGQPAGLLLGLYAPGFCGDIHKDWRCYLEGGKEYTEEWYGRCRSNPKIQFAALYIDESPEFLVEHVTASNFPWEDWRLRMGGARDASGTWVERARD
jgi:hypothetical protein